MTPTAHHPDLLYTLNVARQVIDSMAQYITMPHMPATESATRLLSEAAMAHARINEVIEDYTYTTAEAA